MLSQLGAYLKGLRIQCGLTLRQVERATGISNAYLSQLETGKIANPSLDYAIKLADFYNVSIFTFTNLVDGFDKHTDDLSIHGLTADEWRELTAYLAYYRERQKARGV